MSGTPVLRAPEQEAQMVTASEQRGIHAAHEAGRHDPVDQFPYPGKGPDPRCKICAREAKEQEATVAKVKTQCQCGGTFDGTPSGRKAHDDTKKHREWLAAAVATTVNGQFLGAEPVDRPLPKEVPVSVSPNADLIADVTAAIVETSRELDRRRVDHKWRVANRPQEADAYRLDKVVPLESRKRLLERIRDVLSAS